MAGVTAQPAAGQAPTIKPRVALLSVSDPAGLANRELLAALFEDIANELSRYRTFTVLAPHSAKAVVHRSGVPQDNSVLKADFAISGFVKPGSDVTLAIRMTDCRRESIVWAAEYAAGSNELVRTFRTLSAQIASTLAAELEREMLGSVNLDRDGQAYLHYLQGQNLLKDCTLPGLRRARRTFRQSARFDPDFALPNGRIAQTYYLEWLIRGGSEPELLLKARQYARKATTLDPGAAIGFWINAIVDLYQRNFDAAAEQFAEAEALSPNSADLLVEHADALGHLGQADLGWRKFERAIELNPLPPDHYWWAGASIAFCQERYETAIELCGRMKNAEPAVRLLAASHALLGQEPEARAYGRRIKEMYPSQPAGEIIKVAPTRVEKVGSQFLKGLRIAGV
jgi:TolB-like protein